MVKNISMVNKRRNKYWLINAVLFLVLKLNIFRCKNVWLFGCWEGNKFADNSRYFFEYVNKYHKDIKCVWITRQEEIYKELKKCGYLVCMNNTWEGVKWQLKSGVAFYTNGLDDFSNICLVSGAKVVALWHGTGMKNIYYAREKNTESIRFSLKLIKDRIFNAVYRDVSIATSELSKSNLANNLRLDSNKIFITGYPRNDIYKEQLKPSQVLKIIENADSYSYILIMPTHRPYESNHIDEMVKSLSNNETLQRKLKTTNTVLLFKLHYLDFANKIIQSDHLIMLNDEDVSSAVELQAIADCLITDYSSCITDFSLQEKEIMIYAPDFDEYKERSGVNQYWAKLISRFAIKDPDELADEIADCAERIRQHKINPDFNLNLRLRNIIHESYEDDSITGSCYSENVYNLILSFL